MEIAHIPGRPADGPFMRVNDYCDALSQWLTLIEEKAAREQDAPYKDLNIQKIAVAAPALRLAIEKSNYLYRRIYLGEPHRTEPCPVHDGRWSGCRIEPCEHCASGINQTGWLSSERNSREGT